MPRTLAVVAALLAAPFAVGQPKPPPPPTDPTTLARIAVKTAELESLVSSLPATTPTDVRADVEVYLKAAEWAARHGEFALKDAADRTLAVIDAGVVRAAAAKSGKTPWRDVRGRPVIRGYRSNVDGSVQPFAVTLPPGYPGGADKLWRLDVVLHGRDDALNEVKFIASKERAKAGGAADRVVLEPFGRGNNAYRWAGETDVLEAIAHVDALGRGRIDVDRVVLRGFSMGGAGAWHLGLHHPRSFAAVAPGAGFTTTRGYDKGLPESLPDYVERCLRIYDAVDSAENAFNVPVVAYSGADDPQKAAADNIERALAKFREPVRFAHLIAPGLKHQQPPAWVAKIDAEIEKQLPRRAPDRVRLVAHTAKYGNGECVVVYGLVRHYDRAVIDVTWKDDEPSVTTSNVRVFSLSRISRDEVLLRVGQTPRREAKAVTIDGQSYPWPKSEVTNRPALTAVFTKQGRSWRGVSPNWMLDPDHAPEKLRNLQGPIDDGFTSRFVAVKPSVGGYHAASLARFAREWDRYFRAELPVVTPDELTGRDVSGGNLILFGTPETNPIIKEILPKLPIHWTRTELTVNGVTYDAATHVPVLIYPNPNQPMKYVVLNSGHTFHEADLKATNARLYPRLGDWAVLKPKPAADDPAAAEVVAAGLFDEYWKFPKAK